MTIILNEELLGSDDEIIFADRKDKRRFITNSVIAAVFAGLGIMTALLV
jgi:hypothetical protein